MTQPTIDASDELWDLLFQALDHGVDSLREGGPLTPFTLTQTSAGHQIRRFVAELLEEGVAAARQSIAAEASTTLRYALALDGYITIEGVRYDAVIVEVAEHDKDHGYAMAQRYRPHSAATAFEAIGNPAYLGEVPNLLKPGGGLA